MKMNNPSDLYSSQDWAQLFLLCADAKGHEEDSESPFFIKVSDWLYRYSRDHDLPYLTNSEVTETIREALMFLDKFSENHIDDLYNR